MTIKFSAVDPRGITVSCETSQWYDHVTTGEHEIMANNERAVIDTIKNPDLIFRGTHFQGEQVYFKKGAESTYNSSYHTRVAVEYIGDNRSKVITAYPTSKKKGGIESDPIYQK